LETVGPWYRWLLRRARVVFVPNASTVPESRLAEDELRRLNATLRAGQERLVIYFGFANPNKGVELVFQIANPARDWLLLICDLERANPYQRRLLDASDTPAWRGKVTVTGFLPPDRVADSSRQRTLWCSRSPVVAESGTFLFTLYRSKAYC
jgi:hypothetical protein